MIEIRLRGRARQSAISFCFAILGLGVIFTGSVGCGNGPPQVLIISPANGTFTTAGTVGVSGVLVNVNTEAVADVLVNGISALPLGVGDTFAVTVPLDAQAIVNPIVAEVIGQSGSVLRDRVTVMVGPSIADGDLSPGGVALRLNETGLDEIEPLVTSLVPLDLAGLVPPGTLVVDNFCYQDTIFGCLGRIDATISGSPPPSLNSYAVDVDSMSGFAAGDITLYDLFFRADVVAVTGIGFSCTVDVSAATTFIMGDYGLDPNAGTPDEIDVTQLGGVSISFGSFSDSTNCGGFLGFIVEFFIDLFVSDLQNDLVRPGLQNFLNTTDGQGNTPIAAALETALAAIEIAGPVGEAIGVNLDAPMFTVDEDVDGITLGSDARVTASQPDSNAVNLLASYHVGQPFPTFGLLAPNGQPYELGVCISASAFNQLLKAEVESGMLITSISEFDFGSGPQTVTAGLLSTVLPGFDVLDPSEELRFDVYPTIAPIMTGEVGPAGQLATVRVAHLLLTVVPVADPSVALLVGAVDVEIGLDAVFTGGELSFVIGAPTAQNVNVTLLENPLLVSETTLDALLPGLVGLLMPTLADTLGTFPLPDFLGLELGLVDIDRNGEYTSLFFDMTPVP